MKPILFITSLLGASIIFASNMETYDIKIEANENHLTVIANFSRTTPDLKDAVNRVLHKNIGTIDYRSDHKNIIKFNECYPAAAGFVHVDGKLVFKPSNRNLTSISFLNFFDAPSVKARGMSKEEWIAAIKKEFDEIETIKEN